MAIVKASFTKRSAGAKASIRYIQHRPGKDGARTTRTLFGRDGLMGRFEAYRMIDTAEQGSVFFRFVMSPDPKEEDAQQDLPLRAVTEQTMLSLEERLHKQVSWVAVEHADHAPHRHVHIVAVIAGRLNPQDFHALRHTATNACVEQRHERDHIREQAREEAVWEQGY
jgi:hypothetical protein